MSQPLDLPRGHDFPWTRKAVRSTGDATAATLWDPAASKAVVLWRIIASLSAAGTITIFWGTDAAANYVIDAEVGVGIPVYLDLPYEAPEKGAVNEILKITTTGGGNAKVQMYGLEEA